MSDPLNKLLWNQFGAALDMLENAIKHCPEDVWSDNEQFHKIWYMVYHTLFWTDYYLSDDPPNFKPPAPYGLEEFEDNMDLPDPPFTKAAMLAYLVHCRERLRIAMNGLTDPYTTKTWKGETREFPIFEMHFYNMRHVEHHTAQLNMLLRLRINSTPKPSWVSRTKLELNS